AGTPLSKAITTSRDTRVYEMRFTIDLQNMQNLDVIRLFVHEAVAQGRGRTVRHFYSQNTLLYHNIGLSG
ncbi:MAG: hypothetical protein WBD79_25790, partial [Anaerolineae bacterium]